jgi:hypothetical protein
VPGDLEREVVYQLSQKLALLPGGGFSGARVDLLVVGDEALDLVFVLLGAKPEALLVERVEQRLLETLRGSRA